MSDTETCYTCDGCGDDRLSDQPGAEAYFTPRLGGGEDIMCRPCIDRAKEAELAAGAALLGAEPAAVADATLRVLRAWATVDAESKLYQARYRAREKRGGANGWTRNELDARLRSAERRCRQLGVGEAQDG